MGMEYFGIYDFPLSEGKKEEVLRIIKNDIEKIDVEILTEDNDSLSLRFKLYERRGKWPEDLLIKVENKQCYVCLYSATATYTEKVLNLLYQYFHQVGITIIWKEE